MQAEAVGRAERVVDEKHVEVPVVVVIEESRLSRVPLLSEAIRLCHFLEGGNAVLVGPLIDVELVCAGFAGNHARVADVYVEQPIAVYVRNRDPCRPGAFSAHACLGGDVLKLEVPLVQIEMVPVLIGSQHHLGKSISIQVANGNATTVVEIAVGEDVEILGVLEAIHEMQPGVARGQQREKMIFYWRGRGSTAGDFLLLLVAGASGEIQRGKEIAKPQPQGRIDQLLTTFAHHGLLSEENRP